MGKGGGCCGGSSAPSVQTYAGDDRPVADMGLPETVVLDNPSRSVLSSDCPMLLLFILFWVGMFVVADIAFSKGDPKRLLYGTDYQGNLCGQGDPPAGWADLPFSRTNIQSHRWEDNTRIWYPLPSQGGDLTEDAMANFDASKSVAAGICVQKCPQFNSNLTAQQVINEGGQPSLNVVYTYGEANNARLAESYYVWYDSEETFRRCLPTEDSKKISSALVGAVDNLPGATRVTNWFQRGLADLEEAYIILIFAGIIGFFLPFFYVLILRVILKPMVWICLILILIGLGVSGYLAYRRYDDLDNDAVSENDNDAKLWLAFAILCWIFAALWLCFIIWFRKHINAACEIIQEAGKVLTSDPSILAVPVITGITVLALLCWVMFVGVYAYTIEEDSVAEDLGNNLTLAIPEDAATKQNLLYYNFFGWLWTMGVLSALGYFVVSAATVQWYYSHVQDSEKKATCVLGWAKGYLWGLFYHLGCLITGALLVAILQFIRFIIQKVTQNLKEKSETIACIMCIVDCCLAYVERILQYISRNAYIMTAIEGTGFWCSCCKVINILIGSIQYLAPLIVVTDVVFFIGKLFLIAANVFIAYMLMEDHDMAPNVDNGIFVLIVVGIEAYLLAQLFLSVYESAIDTMFILVFHENAQPKDPALFFCPEEVFKTVTGKEKSDASIFKAEFANQGVGHKEPTAEHPPAEEEKA